MAVNDNPNPERPDGTKLVVGSQGEDLFQETESGKLVLRRGAAADQADIDLGTVGEPHDLVTDGDFESDPKNAGGAEAFAGKIISADGRDFSVKIDWLDDDDNVTITHDPPSLTNVTDVEFNIVMRSDRFELRVEDASGEAQNEINGTANAH